jgi:hypothetical protein
MSVIKFYNDDIKKEIEFSGYITTFSDSHKAEYDQQVIALNPDIYRIFKNSNRGLSFGFQIVSQNLEQARDNIANLNILIAMIYPSYKKESGVNKNVKFKTPAITKILYYNLIRHPDPSIPHSLGAQKAGLPCYVYSIDVKPQLESGFFTYVNDKNTFLLPKLINIDMSVQIKLSREKVQPYTESTSTDDPYIYNPNYAWALDYTNLSAGGPTGGGTEGSDTPAGTGASTAARPKPAPKPTNPAAAAKEKAKAEGGGSESPPAPPPKEKPKEPSAGPPKPRGPSRSEPAKK